MILLSQSDGGFFMSNAHLPISRNGGDLGEKKCATISRRSAKDWPGAIRSVARAATLGLNRNTEVANLDQPDQLLKRRAIQMNRRSFLSFLAPLPLLPLLPMLLTRTTNPMEFQKGQKVVCVDSDPHLLPEGEYEVAQSPLLSMEKSTQLRKGSRSAMEVTG